MTRADGRWRLWIDTGGTFTDALGVAPDASLHRVKVLSSSALRGRVASPGGPSAGSSTSRRIHLEAPWRTPRGFAVGARFHLLAGAVEPSDGSEEAPGIPVVASEPAPEDDSGREPGGGTGIVLELAEPPPSSLEPGRAAELRFTEEAPVLAARLLTGVARAEDLPPLALRLATTRGTNALLTRQGGRVAFLVTEGFGDLLEIGTQQRPELFALEIVKPRPLYDAVVEVPERLAADGSLLTPLDEGALEALAPRLEELLESGFQTAAVALLHSYRNPVHEERLARFLQRRGWPRVVTSAELAPLIRILPRAETAVVEAFLAPVLSEYLAGVEGALPEGSVHVMTSAGGLVRSTEFRAKDSLLSGPAGGVVGAARAGRASGFQRVLSFDMGGTSTDVARYDGDYEYVFEHRVGDARLVAPALAIETVAAGGGSVCSFDGDRLRVGPESAGAAPGPACYGAGGPLTLTDVNLLLGRLDPERFEIPLDPTAAAGAARALGETAGVPSLQAMLTGLLQIADERMADAIREISVRRGYDPGDHALVAFGGAGAQHACRVAELLGTPVVVVPEDAGLLSARGLGAAVLERFAHRQVLEPLSELAPRLASLLAAMGEEARRRVAGEGVAEEGIQVRRRILHLRFAGQDATLPVEVPPGREHRVEEAFDAAYRARYGYRPEGRELEVESIRVVASSEPGEAPAGRAEVPGEVGEGRAAEPGGSRQVVFRGPGGEPREHTAAVHQRSALRPGEIFTGPALVFERHSATVVPPGWWGRRDAAGALVLERD